MRVTSAHFRDFKRFKDLTIQLPSTGTRLVVIAGPNGTGKSSIFDGFKVWQGSRYTGFNQDPLYYDRPEARQSQQASQRVSIDFDRPPTSVEEFKRAFYIRSAYRHEADFTMAQIQRTPSLLDQNRFWKMIDQDVAVSQNYQQLVAQTFEGMFEPQNNDMRVEALREQLIGQVRAAMHRVFPDLVLEGLQSPMSGDGSFFFEKGVSRKWHYKNLSGGERAAFDLLLDIIVKRAAFHDTIYCIDEPETHLNTKVQAVLLRELVNQIPEGCQLWIASHSIGMMREALTMCDEGASVVFLDFGDRDFDMPVVIEPSRPDRHFWQSVLSVALDDLAGLVAPKEVVLVEGKPLIQGTTRRDSNVEFDARCLRTIFEPYRPQSGFISGGGSHEVAHDRLALGSGIAALVPGASLIRLIDRDDRTDAEVEALRRGGCRVLGRRDIENYLLADDILRKVATEMGKPGMGDALVAEKQRLLGDGMLAGRPADDVKAVVGPLRQFIRRELALTQSGNTPHAFLSDTMAPLITPDTATYQELEQAIFG
ncbi:MAG: hypothetical protein OJF49_001064 [Ktedonobacterales bacterium]|jgi:predicted ATPase|nr:MAG: hypothetical protein OJF49_001064 [Ktedonobacterales bacterium]